MLCYTVPARLVSFERPDALPDLPAYLCLEDRSQPRGTAGNGARKHPGKPARQQVRQTRSQMASAQRFLAGLARVAVGTMGAAGQEEERLERSRKRQRA